MEEWRCPRCGLQGVQSTADVYREFGIVCTLCANHARFPEAFPDPLRRRSPVTGNNQFDPPFDGKRCPMCPVETRSLYAVATNLLHALDDRNRQHKVPERIEELRRAVEMVQPLVDAHFADRGHAYGDRSRFNFGERVSPRPAEPDPREAVVEAAKLCRELYYDKRQRSGPLAREAWARDCVKAEQVLLAAVAALAEGSEAGVPSTWTGVNVTTDDP